MFFVLTSGGGGRFVNVVTALFKLEQNAEILSKQAKNQESAFVQHAEENEKLRKELEEQKAAVAESQAKLTQTKMMAKQVENQQKEYLRVLDENERLQKEVQDLTDRLTAKSSQGKKDD
jgi:regulator of replication initiation timing